MIVITTLLPIEGGNDKEYLLRSNCWIGAGKSLSWPVLIAQLLLLFAAFALGKVFFFCVGGLDLEIAAVDGRSRFCCSRCLLIFSPSSPAASICFCCERKDCSVLLHFFSSCPRLLYSDDDDVQPTTRPPPPRPAAEAALFISSCERVCAR